MEVTNEVAMKLGFKAVEIERSAAFKSAQFGIGDTRVIMEILRGKMYSNPVQTICQEIMSNARDAHREVGKHDVPIEVKLPTKLDPSFWIRDFGPSVTPDRMSNVFILYGNSTKRENNIETGGFGLGAKCPFAYSDNFTVISTTQEGDVRIRRQYLAHIDESGKGEMTLVQEKETEEPQGTTIVLTPKAADIPAFKKFVKQSAAHWKVRPVIHGDPEWEWPEFSVPYKGKNWTIHHYKAGGRAARYNYRANQEWVYGTAPVALIDGIPYRLHLNHIFPQGLPRNLSRIGSVPLRLFFDVGEIAVTANREDLDYQPSVIKHLQQRIKDAMQELTEQLTEKMHKIDNLFDAIIYWQELRRQTYGHLLTTSEWKGIALSSKERIQIDRSKNIFVSAYKRDPGSRTGCRKQATRSYYGNSNTTVQIRKGIRFVEDDTGKKVVSRARLATLFDQDPELQKVVLVNLSKNEKTIKVDGEEKTVFEPATEAQIKSKRGHLEKTHLWSSLKVISLNTIPKKELAPKTKGPAAKRKPAIRVRRYVLAKKGTHGSWQASDKSEFDDVNYYVEVSGNATYLDRSKGKTITPRNLPGVMKTLSKEIKGFKLFGVIPSHVKRLGNNWKPLLPEITKLYEESRKTLPEDMHIGGVAYQIMNNAWWKPIAKHKDRLSNGLFKRWIEQGLETGKRFESLNRVNSLAKIIGKPQLYISNRVVAKNDYGKLYHQVTKQYPLVMVLCKSHNYSTDALDDLISYVSMKDTEVTNA